MCERPSRPSGRARHLAAVHGGPGLAKPFLLATSLLLVACDLSLDLPTFDTEWAAPSVTATVAADAFLPIGLALNTDRTRFMLTASPATVQAKLSQLCIECAAVDGQRVLKPAFSSQVDVPIALPAAFRGGALASGSFTVELANALGFDVLRPGLSMSGTINITVLAGTATLATLDVTGASAGLPSGQTLTRTVPLLSANVGDSLKLRVTVTSPLGIATQISANNQFTIKATPTSLAFAQAIVEGGKSMSLTPALLNINEVGASFNAHLTGARLRVAVTNPFGRAFTGTLRIQGGGATDFAQNVQIPSTATSALSLDLDGAAARSFLGRSGVTLRGTIVSGTGNFTVTPTSALTLRTQWTYFVSSSTPTASTGGAGGGA